MDGNYLVIKYGPTLRVRMFVGRGRVSYNKILWTVTRTHNYTLALSSSSVCLFKDKFYPRFITLRICHPGLRSCLGHAVPFWHVAPVN